METVSSADQITWIEEATNQLRWVLKEGPWRTHRYEPVRCLQQRFIRRRRDQFGAVFEVEEWRDVPTVEEK